MIKINKDEYLFIKKHFPNDVVKTTHRYYMAEIPQCLAKLYHYWDSLSKSKKNK